MWGSAVARPKLHMDRRRWLSLLVDLRRRSGNVHEAGAFLLGRIEGRDRRVEHVIFYDDLDSNAYASGVCILEADSFELLWQDCRKTGLSVVADVHLHGGRAGQSSSDRDNPMIARPGHLALIVPRFARAPVWRHRLGVYQYLGSHRWTDFSGWRARSIVKTGTWR